LLVGEGRWLSSMKFTIKPFHSDWKKFDYFFDFKSLKSFRLLQAKTEYSKDLLDLRLWIEIIACQVGFPKLPQVTKSLSNNQDLELTLRESPSM
jgi:hypothetical protein